MKMKRGTEIKTDLEERKVVLNREPDVKKALEKN